jgi:hypothetical protein
MDRINLNELNDVEGKGKFRIEVSNRFFSFGRFGHTGGN